MSLGRRALAGRPEPCESRSLCVQVCAGGPALAAQSDPVLPFDGNPRAFRAESALRAHRHRPETRSRPGRHRPGLCAAARKTPRGAPRGQRGEKAGAGRGSPSQSTPPSATAAPPARSRFQVLRWGPRNSPFARSRAAEGSDPGGAGSRLRFYRCELSRPPSRSSPCCRLSMSEVRGMLLKQT